MDRGASCYPPVRSAACRGSARSAAPACRTGTCAAAGCCSAARTAATCERDLTACPADARDVGYGGDPGLDAVRLRLTERRLRALVPDGRSVFEIGYGSGALLRRLLDAGWSVGGVDKGQLEVGVDAEVARRGAARPRRAGDRSRPRAAHDLVVGVHVLEHLRDPAAGLAAAYRLLRPAARSRWSRRPPTRSGRTGSATPGGCWRTRPTCGSSRPTRPAGRWPGPGSTGVRVRRLLLDTLSMEAASLRRAAGRRQRPRGVLAERGTVLAALAAAPVTVAARAAVPRLRPSLELVAHRPG